MAIYLFHGVVDRLHHRVRNYARKHIERDYFTDFLRARRSEGTALSMDEVIGLKREGKRPPKKSFVVTFDDGFENNFTIAAPILRDLNIPALFYVTSGFIEHNWMSWIDRIELCFEETNRGTVTLPWEDVPRTFFTDEGKIEILKAIRLRVKADPKIDHDELVSTLFTQCGRDEVFSSLDPLDRKMTWEQVRALNDDSLFKVGGHSHKHGILSFLSDDDLESELETSIALLREKSGITSPHYSYPEGLAHCFDERVIHGLKKRGIECCPTAIEGINDLSEDLFHLKRIMVV